MALDDVQVHQQRGHRFGAHAGAAVGALHASGAFGKWLIQLARTDVLIIDDRATGQIDAVTRGDLLEIIDDRATSARRSSPTNSRSSIGTAGSATRPSPTPSSIA